MAIRFRCPFCKKHLRLMKVEKLGQPMQCPNPDCQKWIMLGEAGSAQASPLPPLVGVGGQTEPQPKEQWLKQDGIEDDRMLNKVKRPTVAPPLPQGFRRTESPPADDSDWPSLLPPNRQQFSEAPPPLRGGSQPLNFAPPPPRPISPRMSNAKGGGSRIWLFLVLFIGLAGLGVGAYLIFKPAASSIPIEPEKVSKGQFGVIEIGTTGVRALIVEPFTTTDSYDYKMIKDYKPLNISSGKLQEDGKSFDPKSLQHTKNAVKEFFDDMQVTYKLPPERIAIVRSSGVIAGFKDIVSLEENRKLLNRAVREVTGSDLDAYTPHSEARYTAMFVIPPSAKGDSILLDLGSGNIKGGFFNADNQFLSTDIDSGTKRFATSVEKKVKEDKADFKTTAIELSQKLIAAPLRRDIEANGALLMRKRIFLCGGLTWVLRMYTHPNDNVEDLTVELKAEDIEKFKTLVNGNTPEQVQALILAEVKEETQRVALKAQITDIQGIFNANTLKAGAEILTAVSETYEFKKKRLTYYNKGPVAPNMGYVLSRLGLAR